METLIRLSHSTSEQCLPLVIRSQNTYLKQTRFQINPTDGKLEALLKLTQKYKRMRLYLIQKTMKMLILLQWKILSHANSPLTLPNGTVFKGLNRRIMKVNAWQGASVASYRSCFTANCQWAIVMAHVNCLGLHFEACLIRSTRLAPGSPVSRNTCTRVECEAFIRLTQGFPEWLVLPITRQR